MNLCVPRGERLPDRRMREIGHRPQGGPSGGTRDEGQTIPPLLYREKSSSACSRGWIVGNLRWWSVAKSLNFYNFS